jgi:hypothetical protein
LAGVPVPGLAFAPVIVFIPRSGDGCKPGDYDAEWLPRQCPACWELAIIGHGRRQRPAHDPIHDWIWVRRGICKICDKTLTVLPGWCVPRSPYSLLARQQAIDRLCQGCPAEEAAPLCRHPDHLPDGSTVRRWFGRFFQGLRLLALPPTLLAWDWRAASRILIAEPISP